MVDTYLDVLKKINKKAANLVTTGSALHNWEAISTGLESLDAATGIGGIPRGALTEVFGRESSGKTLLLIETAKQAQKEGPVLLLDFENSYTEEYLTALGLKLDATCFFLKPDTMEEGFAVAEQFIATGDMALIGFDSVGAMLPKTTQDRNTGEAKPGQHSLTLSLCLQKLLPLIKTHRPAVLMTNHIRSRISYTGSGTDTSGGFSLKFYKHLSIELRKIGLIQGPDGPLGMEVKAIIAKSKVSTPFVETPLRLFFGKGFDALQSMMDGFERLGIITVTAQGWVKSDLLDVSIRGRDNFLQELQTNPDLVLKIQTLVEQRRGSSTHAAKEISTQS